MGFKEGRVTLQSFYIKLSKYGVVYARGEGKRKVMGTTEALTPVISRGEDEKRTMSVVQQAERMTVTFKSFRETVQRVTRASQISLSSIPGTPIRSQMQ